MSSSSRLYPFAAPIAPAFFPPPPTWGETYPATVVGYSVTSDVAVRQLQGASHRQTVHIASLGVKVGQRVTAVGNAGGANGKPIAAAGKVTAVGQSIVASDGQGI